jgi:predicted heme/steroid binding protein
MGKVLTMDEFELRRIIYDYIKEICHYSQMQVFATSSYQKNYFQLQIDDDINGLINMFLSYRGDETSGNQFYSNQQIQPVEETPSQTSNNRAVREFSIEELAYNDGSDDKPAYVAVNGNVYDVSMVMRWSGGTHFGLNAGRDLSNEFMGCHGGLIERLEKLPKVGVLV